MKTHLDQSLIYAEESTISAGEWVNRLRRNSAYNWLITKWYLALKELEAAKSEVIPIPWYGSHVLFMTGVDDRMVHKFADLGPGYTIAFSADINESRPGGAYYVTDAQIAIAKSEGGHVASWGDCDATPFIAVASMASSRGLDGAFGQFETDRQYQNMVDYPAAVGIGNPAGLSNSNLYDCISRCTRGHLGTALSIAKMSTITLDDWINRLRTNPTYQFMTTKWYAALVELERAMFKTHPPLHCIGEIMNANPAYSAQGVPITSGCFYLARDGNQGGNQPLSAFASMPADLRAACSLYVDRSMSDDDFSLWYTWT